MFLVVHEDQFAIWSDPDNLDFSRPDGHDVEMWVEIQVECWPTRGLFRRWFCEVSARRIGEFGLRYEDDRAGSMWNHYYTFDYYARSFRRAWMRAEPVAEKLHDHILADPENRPSN